MAPSLGTDKVGISGYHLSGSKECGGQLKLVRGKGKSCRKEGRLQPGEEKHFGACPGSKIYLFSTELCTKAFRRLRDSPSGSDAYLGNLLLRGCVDPSKHEVWHGEITSATFVIQGHFGSFYYAQLDMQ